MKKLEPLSWTTTRLIVCLSGHSKVSFQDFGSSLCSWGAASGSLWIVSPDPGGAAVRCGRGLVRPGRRWPPRAPGDGGPPHQGGGLTVIIDLLHRGLINGWP